VALCTQLSFIFNNDIMCAHILHEEFDFGFVLEQFVFSLADMRIVLFDYLFSSSTLMHAITYGSHATTFLPSIAFKIKNRDEKTGAVKSHTSSEEHAIINLLAFTYHCQSNGIDANAIIRRYFKEVLTGGNESRLQVRASLDEMLAPYSLNYVDCILMVANHVMIQRLGEIGR